MAYDAADDGRRDFHFLYGRWAVRHRLLKASGSDDWTELAGTSFCHGLLGGVCNVDEYDFADGRRAVAIRTFEVEARRWAIYWATADGGVLGPPVYGRFDGGVGRFRGDDVSAGRPVKVEFVWEVASDGSARWRQAFSYDGGETWETNWIMDFTRTS